ncbi:lipase family alpha/beta hydrolase [Nocardia sp. CA-290969]|uniref:lipase family alpha/beta hydrolase n=1 Tax=Nocardia sp. CA-290969 TaxID=3239986 RepID=UPI003D90CB02
MIVGIRSRHPSRLQRIGRPVAAFAAACLLAVPGAAQADPVLPVPFGAEATRAAVTHYSDPVSAPPGANDWNCRPGTHHPEPVVLLHGYTASQAGNWQTLAPLLVNNGYCVFSLTYGLGAAADPATPGGTEVRVSAERDVAPFVERVLEATGAERVHLVGHSMGTVAARYYTAVLGGAAQVARSVNIAPLNQGTDVLGAATMTDIAEKLGVADLVERAALSLGSTPGGNDLLRGSDLMDELAAAGFPENVAYTFLMTRYDELVVPYTSGRGPVASNITNIVVQDHCPDALFEHFTAASDPVVAQYVLAALDPAGGAAIDCAGRPRNS